MAVRGDISVNWDASPRVITVAAPSTVVEIQDLVDTLRVLEAEQTNLTYPPLLTAAGKESLGAGFVGITVTLQNAQVAFEPRPGPAYAQCAVSGGNLVATDAYGFNITPIYPTDYTQVVIYQSTSPTLLVSNATVGPLTEQDKADIAARVWGVPLAQAQTPGTIGEWVSKKILSLKQFLALT